MYRQMNELIIEGTKDILEILKDKNLKISEILWNKKALESSNFEDIKNLAISKKIKITEITAQQFKNIRKTVHSQGVFLVFENPNNHKIDEILKKSRCIIFLNGIQDPGNFGTIIRTAGLLGIDAILADKSCAKLENPKVLRASKGYFTKIPILENFVFDEKILKNNGFEILVADSNNNANSIYEPINIQEKLCIVFGSEGNGISDFLQKYKKIYIPMQEKNASLNVAVSVGIIIFEVMKKWKIK